LSNPDTSRDKAAAEIIAAYESEFDRLEDTWKGLETKAGDGVADPRISAVVPAFAARRSSCATIPELIGMFSLVFT